ncbi:MAG: 3-isopropylmalate dehydratase small subunit [Cyanobacteria bacterium]|nr:3-isopropylmalate dehydratase small subunit [Cyanobacteriota bacterium]
MSSHIAIAPITLIQSALTPLNRSDIDTDQIIPARFLKGTVKTGLGEKLFHDLRYLPNGSPNPEFILNQPEYKDSQILIAFHNFGCGSSREHAPWALKDYGFQAVLAVSFADIFKNNALKNGLLTIALPEAVILHLLQEATSKPEQTLKIDLPSQTVTLPSGKTEHFDIDPYRKRCLVEGLDDIGFTLGFEKEIEAYENALLERGLA